MLSYKHVKLCRVANNFFRVALREKLMMMTMMMNARIKGVFYRLYCCYGNVW